MPKIGVYGTLKRNHSNHSVLQGSRYLGTGRIYGYKMYDLGLFPGVVPCEDTDYLPNELKPSVTLEIYEVSQEILDDVDILEGYDENRESESLYLRRKLTSENFGAVWVYFYNSNAILDHSDEIEYWPLTR